MFASVFAALLLLAPLRTAPPVSEIAAAAALAQAQTALNRGAAEEAAALAARATLGPRPGRAWLLLGLARFRLQQLEPARAAFALALECEPLSAVAAFNLGSAQFELGQFADAKASYLSAAALDPAVAPLATYDAGLAAARLDQLDAAIALFLAAASRAKDVGKESLAQKAEQALDDAESARREQGQARILDLARAGRLELHADHFGNAISSYRAALAEALAIAAPPADLAELHFSLGYAELEGMGGPAAIPELALANRLSPEEPSFHFMLGLAELRAEEPLSAWAELQRASALHPTAEEAQRIAREIDLLWARRLDWQRVSFEARASVGYDTDVPQSGVIQTVTPGQGVPTSAPFLGAGLDAEWRPVGTASDGLTLAYRLDQVAYLSGPTQLDPYSLQEHDLEADGVWSPLPWLRLEAEVEGYLQFAGIATFGPFQDGLLTGPRVVLREGQGWESALRYAHTFKHSLTTPYNYLSGNRDDLWVGELWHNRVGRVSLGYRLEVEQVGVQSLSVSALYFPCPGGDFHCGPPLTDAYLIPYSYSAHTVSLGGTLELPWALRATADLHFEYRPFDNRSYLRAPGPPVVRSYFRSRTDDRYSAELSLGRNFGQHFSLELDYAVVLNQSTIDDTQVATELDYDDKNFLKQVVELIVGTEW